MVDFIVSHPFLDYSIRIFAALLCGSILGLERKIRMHAVGIRTLVLICISSALLSIISVELSKFGNIRGDPTRIAAGVITGIGFVGGGTIIKEGFNIRGITTAAVIFADSGIGLTCGAALYYPAFLTMALILITLFVSEKIEHKLIPQGSTKVVSLEFTDEDIDEKQIEQVFKNNDIIIFDTDLEYSPDEKIVVSYIVKVPSKLDPLTLAKDFSGIPKIKNCKVSKK